MAFKSEIVNIDSSTDKIGLEDEPIILHLDLDMFFAAVEIRNNPDFKGKPLVVGNPNSRRTKRGVVLTASYEARKFGIHSGMSMSKALSLHRDIIISNSSRKDYSAVSNQVMLILQNLGFPMKITSIDEAYLELTGLIKTYEEANILAYEIQKKIKEQERITASIGIGPTLKLAKIASDYNKPEGVTVVSKAGLKQFFNGLPLRKIPGIGKSTSKKLASLSFNYCDELINLDLVDLIQILGHNLGEYLHNVFNAKTSSVIKKKGKRKSISNESTFHGLPSDLTRYNEVINKLFLRSYKTAMEKGFLIKSVTTKIRFNDFDTITRSKTLNYPTNKSSILKDATINLVEPYLTDKRGIRLLGIGFSQLSKKSKLQNSINDYF